MGWGEPLTPENPTGRWEVPYEAVTEPVEAEIWSIQCDALSVTAGVADTPLGRLPVIVFDFASSALPREDHPPRITFIGSIDGVRAIRKLIGGACNGAIRAAGGEA